MRKITLTLSAAALALAGSAGLAYAAQNHAMHSPDADGDGVVTKAEMDAHADAMWKMLDANGDGVVNEADRAAHMDDRMERRAEKFAEIDTDGNGEVSQAEMEAHHVAMMADRTQHHAEMFAKLDTDGSGGLSPEELKAAHEMHRGDHGDRHGPGGDRMGERRGGKMMLRMADADKDGTITRAEFDAARAKHFEMIDTDGDGTISQAEHDAAREKMHERMQNWREKRQPN